MVAVLKSFSTVNSNEEESKIYNNLVIFNFISTNTFSLISLLRDSAILKIYQSNKTHFFVESKKIGTK